MPHEELAQSNGLLPNGLLPNEFGSVIRVLDSERWLKAEERTAELIACIQPNQPSEERRNAVAYYVQRLIRKCFPCQVFTYGSVPLKTYLPDGDIDLTAFSKNQNLKDTWANQVRDILESEEKNENAEFRVKEVQYIQAEVKIIKCLVENIVVDISFNQLGGLCTLCFLEEIDHLIGLDHLFKRSIILIKAWCYYESRILGAHHGLISTYALETLVLYIFHVFNNSFAGPLEVLYRFLEFFSQFDWDTFCVSLWGPVPIGSLPDVTAEPPRKDGGRLLLEKRFLDACSSVYAVLPGAQENQGQPFVSKHFNVIDPLRVNNNLGRSVSQGNFYRIRSAFAFGAKRLARILDCPIENICFELNQFFMNTWERHGSGNRPDALMSELWHLKPSNPDHIRGSDNQRDTSNSDKINETSSVNEIEVEGPQSSGTLSSQRSSYPLALPHTQSHKSHGNTNNSQISEHAVEGNSNKSTHLVRGQSSSKHRHMVNEVQGKYLFARTRSSPELTETSYDAASRTRQNNPAESGKIQMGSARMDSGRRKNVAFENPSFSQISISSTDDPSSSRQSSPRRTHDIAIDSNGVSNSDIDESGTGNLSEERASVMGALGMHQEEQDLVNVMSSFPIHNFNAQDQMPLDFASTPLPPPISPSMLASMGYAQSNPEGMIPSNFPLIQAQWASNLQFHPDLISSPLAQYFPEAGFGSNSDDLEQGNVNFASMESSRGADSEFWHEQDESSNGRFGHDHESMDTVNAADRRPSTSTSSNFVPSSHVGGFGGSMQSQKSTKENRGSMGEDHSLETSRYLDSRLNEYCSDDRISSSRLSSRSKTSSESSWDGSSKSSKVSRERRGRKTGTSRSASTVYGKGKGVSEHASADPDDDHGDRIAVSATAPETSERSITTHTASLQVPRQHLSGFEAAGDNSNRPDSLMPVAPMLLGPGSRQTVTDNSGVVPVAFYPTGPPVPFLTMLPVYNIPNKTGTSDASSSHPGGGEGLHNSDSGQNFGASEGYDESEVLNNYSMTHTATELMGQHNSDILHSDFASHWQNLRYGRFCQNTRFPFIYPSPVMVPPMYLQGQVPWDGPGRPLTTNVNMFSQLVNYSPHLVPAASLQSAPTTFQRQVDEIPRHRSGTGTYLPNPKASIRDRHSTGTRNNYNYDRDERHSDREVNWTTNVKSRASGRSHNRSHPDKSVSRTDRLVPNGPRADHSWGPPFPYQSQNSPLGHNASQSSSSSMAYGMCPLPGASPGPPNGVTVPQVVMFYQYDQNSGYMSPGEQLEFGSLGPVGFAGLNDSSEPAERSRMRGMFEEQRFHGSSTQHSSPDQPSSPHFQRRV